jgi:hypothetical protein
MQLHLSFRYYLIFLAIHCFASSLPLRSSLRHATPDLTPPLLQRRLRAVELERDQLRVERDRFRSILSAAQRYPFQSQQAQLASLGLSPSAPTTGAVAAGVVGMRVPLTAPAQAARPAADGSL